MTQYDDDDSDEDDEDLAHLDPTVAALLQPLKNDEVTQSLLRTRIAMMKLQQARIRGNSDYAAKIMDYAIEEGARDRTAWNLLEKHMKKLEHQVSSMDSTSAAASDEGESDNDDDNKDKKAEESEKDDDRKDDNEEEDDVTSEKVKALKDDLAKEQERATAAEELLEQCMLNEIEDVLKEQTSLKESEDRLRTKIRSLQQNISKLPSEATKRLEDKLTEVHENQSTLLDHTQCSVCHEHPATKAVIPCGHLCLCDKCTSALTKQDARQCPLCRGQLLSTLHIYTTK